jgi:hypothetical protein
MLWDETLFNLNQLSYGREADKILICMSTYQSTKSRMNKIKFTQIYVFFCSELILNSLLWLS